LLFAETVYAARYVCAEFDFIVFNSKITTYTITLVGKSKIFKFNLMRRVKVKLGPRYDMGQHAPKEEEGWKIRMYGQDWAIWFKH